MRVRSQLDQLEPLLGGFFVVLPSPAALQPNPSKFFFFFFSVFFSLSLSSNHSSYTESRIVSGADKAVY